MKAEMNEEQQDMIIEKFLHFDVDLDQLKEWAVEAVEEFQNEGTDEHLIVNAIKSSEYKKHAFECGGDIDYSALDET